jgi:hypothetical protein
MNSRGSKQTRVGMMLQYPPPPPSCQISHETSKSDGPLHFPAANTWECENILHYATPARTSSPHGAHPGRHTKFSGHPREVFRSPGDGASHRLSSPASAQCVCCGHWALGTGHWALGTGQGSHAMPCLLVA